MITFSDVKRTGKRNTFFLPEPIKQEILPYLQEAGIPHWYLKWNETPYDMIPKKEKAREWYESVGYDYGTYMGAIISDIDPSDMFHKSLLFFGDTIDPDYKKQKEENKKEAQEIYKKQYTVKTVINARQTNLVVSKNGSFYFVFCHTSPFNSTFRCAII